MINKQFTLDQSLVTGCRILEQTGVFNQQGHLSARTDPETIRVTRGISPGLIGMSDILQTEIAADTVPEEAPSELPIHTEIYARRDDVMAICHHHGQYSVIIGSSDVEHRPVHLDGTVQTSPIAVFESYKPRSGTLITTKETAQELADTLGSDRAVLLRGHGAVVVGSSVADVVVNSIKLEYNSMLLYQQSLLGEPWYVPDDLLMDEATIEETPALEKLYEYFLRGTGAF